MYSGKVPPGVRSTTAAILADSWMSHAGDARLKREKDVGMSKQDL